MDNNKTVIHVYNKIAKAYADAFSKPSDHMDEFLELLSENGKVLDIGCGVGVDSDYAQTRGFKVVGVDMSEKMLEIARSNNSNVDFRLEDVRSVEFGENEFDGIIASCSLIHIPKEEVPKTLKRLSLFLKPGGIIYVSLQAGESKEIFIDEPFKPDEKLFLNIFSFDEIKKLLTDEGFEIMHRHERKAEKKEELDFTKLYIIAVKQGAHRNIAEHGISGSEN